jgi:hypothetical protein
MRFTPSFLILGVIIACGGQKAGPGAPFVPPGIASGAVAAPEPERSEAPTTPTEKEAAPEAAPEVPAACTKDRDCVVTTFAGCCACPGMPTAFFKPDLAKLEKKCDKVRCPPVVDMNCGEAVDVTTYRARCVDDRCVAEPR